MLRCWPFQQSQRTWAGHWSRLQDSSLHGALVRRCFKPNTISKCLSLVTVLRANVENCESIFAVNLAVWGTQAWEYLPAQLPALLMVIAWPAGCGCPKKRDIQPLRSQLTSVYPSYWRDVVRDTVKLHNIFSFHLGSHLLPFEHGCHLHTRGWRVCTFHARAWASFVSEDSAISFPTC